MKEKSKIILAIVIVVVVLASLYFAFMYVAYFHDFCPDANEGKPIPVGCVVRFAEKYFDKNITVRGKYLLGYLPGGRIYGPSAYFAESATSLDFFIIEGVNINISMLVEGEEYYWTGILKIGTLYSDEFTTEVGLYLEVSDIQPV